MSALQLSAAHTIWRARRVQTGGDKAYALYAFLLVVVIVIVPVVRALWVTVSSEAGLAVLTSAAASAAVSSIAAALWAGALLAGRKRGPALLQSFLLHALTGSSIRRAVTLRGPVLRAATIIISACAAGAVLVGMALLRGGYVQLGEVLIFAATAGAAGVVTAVLWLIGQVFPRAALPIAITGLLLAGMSLSKPEMVTFTPWGWVGATYPRAESGTFPLLSMAVLAAASFIMKPVLLGRLTGMQLSSQAARWERAAACLHFFDFRSASSVYETEPHLGRNICAIAPNTYRWLTFFLRDVVGLARTPGRSLGAIISTAAAGVLITLSLLPGTPAALLVGIAGIAIFGATGPLTKGLQHAAEVAGDFPLYGISDKHLILLHVLFPLMTLLAVLTTSATIIAIATGTPPGVPLAGAASAGVLTLALRLGNALKGPLPSSLLAPVSTPAGDLSIVLQIACGLSDPLMAILAGLSITMLPSTPIPLMTLVACVGVVVLVRWNKRR